MAPPGAAATDLVDSPSGAFADFSISGYDPIPGQEKELGFFPSTTIVSIDVHQARRVQPDGPRRPDRRLRRRVLALWRSVPGAVSRRRGLWLPLRGLRPPRSRGHVVLQHPGCRWHTPVRLDGRSLLSSTWCGLFELRRLVGDHAHAAPRVAGGFQGPGHREPRCGAGGPRLHLPRARKST
jgi:hypothetical protein